MPFQSVPNCLEIVVHGTLNGESCVNTFYATKATKPTAADALLAADAVDDVWETYMLPILSNEYAYQYTSARGLTDPEDVYAESNNGAGPGAVGTTCIANNVAMAVKRRSSLTGRAARGRVFIGGLPFSAYEPTTQTMSDTFIGLLESGLNHIQTALDGISLTEVIVHRVSAGVPLPTAVVFSVIEYVVVNNVIDSMRRRLPGRGA